MKIPFSITATIFLLILTQSGVAQNSELKFNLVEGPNGKSLGKIRNMTQDPHGYMWLSGEGGKCIYRFDGSKFTFYKHDDANPSSLGGISINSVYADSSGVIWIGFNDAGLDEFNPATGIFKHYRPSKNDAGSVSGAVTPILRDHQKRLWVGTDNGLDRLDEKTGKFIHYRNEPGNLRSLSSNKVITIYEDHHGDIWIGTDYPWDNNDPNAGGLNRLESDGSFTRYMHDPKNPHSLINNKVRAIFEDSRGVFWVGTAGDGLHTMDRKTGQFERHTYDPSKPLDLSRPPLRNDAWLKANDKAWLRANDQVTFIIEDNIGSIWIGSMFAGINRYDTGTKKITHYEHSFGYPDSSSWNAFQSRDGELWISTQDNNLYRVDPFHKTIHSITTGDEAWNFKEDKQGYLWVSTRGSGLFKFDQQLNLIQQFKHSPSNPLSLPDNIVGPLFQKKENTMWVSTDKGIRVLDETTQKFSLFPDTENLKNFNDSGVTNIFQDKQGIIWFSTWGKGLIRYNPEDHSKNFFYSNEGDSSTISINNVGQIFEDRSGVLWAGTNNGINRLDKKTGKFVRYLDGKGTWAVNLYQDSEGNLWAGTNIGLYRYDEKEDRFVNFFDSNSELNSISLSGVTEDDAKNLWFFSESSIIGLNILTKQISIYASKYGIVPLSMATWKSAYKNGKGQIFIPNSVGFYTFSPEELALKSDFRIIITDLLVNSQPVSPGKESYIQEPVEDISDLDLKYNRNNIAFNFSAIDYREPGTIKYFYMLEGYDRQWQEVKDRKEKNSYYFNLPAGKYVYRVQAFNSDGAKAEKTITIRINPPWWETWWAYTSYVILSVIIIWRIIAWRTKTLKKEKELLETKVALRTKELKQEKEIVESTLAELKSTQAQLIQSEKMASLGELTAGIAHEIQNPLNFVNNFSEVNTELIDELTQEAGNGNIEGVKAIAKDIRDNELKIVQHGKRADAIVKGMLQHSRTSSGLKEPTAINALCDEYLRLAYHGLRAKDKNFNTEMRTEFDSSIGKINVIPQDFGRVILNLINNAFYAVDEKKKQLGDGYKPMVSVSTKRNNGKMEIKVSDNGNGIPKKILDKIFQPFFTTKPTGQGTGLGLSMSYDIIKAHGGEIKIESKENEGANFTVILPAE